MRQGGWGYSGIQCKCVSSERAFFTHTLTHMHELSEQCKCGGRWKLKVGEEEEFGNIMQASSSLLLSHEAL